MPPTLLPMALELVLLFSQASPWAQLRTLAFVVVLGLALRAPRS
jgi:hypothetical protein